MWTPLCLAAVIVGFVWGVSAALVTTLVGLLTFTFVVFPQLSVLMLSFGTAVRTLGPFICVQVVIAFLAGQHAVKYRRTRAAEQKCSAYAQELAATNQKLEQTNQELERANHLKDYFMIRAAHELRTPLTTILGEVQLALRRLHKAENMEREVLQYRKHFEKIEARTRVLQALVEDLIEISSLRTGEKRLQFGPCDFGNLCHEIIENQRTYSGRQIELQLPPDPVIIQADSKRLTQVVIHLVGNALHYSLEDTVISLRVSMEGTHVLFQVHNEGPALPPEQQAHLFDPFYRTASAETRFREGWGLGLTVSKEIVEQHHGHLWVQSSEGEGTTFFMRIPRAER
jgi:signal transduction histidine kinase